MTNLHAHFDTYSTDCDGPISRSYVVTMTEEELAGQDKPNWFGDIEFHNRIAGMVVNTFSLYQSGRLDVDGPDAFESEYRHARLTWSEATEEGGRSTDVMICSNPNCDLGEQSYRDHRAESMNY